VGGSDPDQGRVELKYLNFLSLPQFPLLAKMLPTVNGKKSSKQTSQLRAKN
jgi:hypothetical protein